MGQPDHKFKIETRDGKFWNLSIDGVNMPVIRDEKHGSAIFIENYGGDHSFVTVRLFARNLDIKERT